MLYENEKVNAVHGRNLCILGELHATQEMHSGKNAGLLNVKHGGMFSNIFKVLKSKLYTMLKN
jgi:hypothetical protein